MVLFVAAEKEVDEKSNVFVDLDVVPTLSPNDVKELERNEQVVPEMESVLNPDAWMDAFCRLLTPFPHFWVILTVFGNFVYQATNVLMKTCNFQ